MLKSHLRWVKFEGTLSEKGLVEKETWGVGRLYKAPVGIHSRRGEFDL